MTSSKKPEKAKKSSVRHTRAIQYDRHKRPNSTPTCEQMEAHLESLIHPAVYAQIAEFRSRGLRERTLTLPVMTALVLGLIWRCLGSVEEAVRTLKREGFLWSEPVKVSQQAVSERFRTLPADLFHRILLDVLPRLKERWEQRRRPLPEAVAWAQQRYAEVVALDGSTLDALCRKVGLLREAEGTPLAGRMAALLDVGSQLPKAVWYEEDSQAHDQTFWETVKSALTPGMLVVFDLGWVDYAHFHELCQTGVKFLTRLKTNASFRVQTVLREGPNVRDLLVELGSSSRRCASLLRVVSVTYEGKEYRYLTNELDPSVLPAEVVVALYRQRWRIEDAFSLVKRLLGLAYFFGSSINAIQVQLWMSWVLYAVLIDLTDSIAEELNQPLAMLSVEMTFRGLYHFTQAHLRGETDDPIRYLAENAKDLGILKRKPPQSFHFLRLLTHQLKA